MCTFDLDHVSEVYVKRWRTARKRHACDSCGAAIVRGAQYEAHSGVFEGDPFRHSVCFGCAFDLKAFGEAPGHRGFPAPDWFAEALRDCIDWNGKADSKPWRDVLASMAKRRRWMRGAA